VVNGKNLQLSTSLNMDFDSEQEKLSVMQIVIHPFASNYQIPNKTWQAARIIDFMWD
jgi:hypothetical protein